MTKGKKILFSILTSLLVVILCILAGETVLRFVPIPGVDFAAIRYDEVVGAGYYPNSVVTYRSDRNDYVERVVNRWGYLDVDHEPEKEGGVFRIGFFGDSYTEAMQVPIDSTFFRRIEALTADRSVECLAFGFSGRGTVHSYLVAMQEMVRFDLDMLVYVFCENDVGDQVEERNIDFPVALGVGGAEIQLDRSVVCRVVIY